MNKGELVQAGFTSTQLKALVVEILNEATQQGASSAEVDIGTNKGFSVTARKGEVESVEYHQDKVIDITVYFGKRTGSSSLSDFRPEAIRLAIQAACNIARFTDEDQYSGLADKSLLAFNYPQLDLAYPWSITVEQATISKYNLSGIKRQEAYIHDAMRTLAASMGGDAIINLNKDDKTVTGTVIAYLGEKKQKSSSV